MCSICKNYYPKSRLNEIESIERNMFLCCERCEKFIRGRNKKW